ncbi:large ribosomal subunit protein uL30z-like [Curcuma longa]|uniref:large ribosomal subunit protein uL30z-like n=1 Tax=Curcuma longa TaxID=136217 RepID=UPI003D9F85C7
MAEEPQPLNYVHETVLKKRKISEDWAVKRRGLLAEKKRSKQERFKRPIKRPEEFVKEYRDKELDFVRMKQRVKLRKFPNEAMKSKLLFVIRIHGSKDMHPQTRKILNKLRLVQILNGVFLKANEANLRMLLRVEPFVTYGYPNLKSVKELIYKKGHGKVDKERTPLTDNNVIEQPSLIHLKLGVGLFDSNPFLVQMRNGD